MKKLLVLAGMLMASVAMNLSPVMAEDADVFFESDENYDAYNAGNGKIHIKVLIFGEKGNHNYNAGRGLNYNLNNATIPTPM